MIKNHSSTTWVVKFKLHEQLNSMFDKYKTKQDIPCCYAKK